MKKKLGLLSLGILTILLFVNLASAISFTDSVDTIELNPQDPSQSFTLIADGNASFSVPTVFDLTDGTTIITVTISQQIVNSDHVIYSVEATGDLLEFDFGESRSESVSFEIVNDTNSSDNATKDVLITFKNNDFCEGVASNGLRITIEDVNVINGFGDDDDYWYLYDEIEVEVEVDNRANEDLEDLEVYWELYTTAGVEISSGDVKQFNLRENDEEIVTFTFTLDDDIEEFDREDAVLYVGVKGRGDDTRDDYCAYKEGLAVEVETGYDFVIAGNFMVDEQKFENIFTLSCGQTVKVGADILNLGDYDQDDVSVRVYSSDLGIDERFDFNEVQGFDKEVINFEFDVPKDMEEKTYVVYFEVFDEDNDIFENGEDVKAKTMIFFEGEESCKIEVPAISAELIGEAKAGKGVFVNLVLTNQDEKSRVFLINAENYDSWASLNTIRPKLVELDSGESQEIELILTANSDLEKNDYSFDVVVSSEGEEILVQAVAVNVEPRAFNFGGISQVFENFDWKLWGIVALNVILLLAIIIVTVKIMRKK